MPNSAVPPDLPPGEGGLKRLLTTDAYSSPFPETTYTGDDLAVYQWFVAELHGVEPMRHTLEMNALEAPILRRPAGRFPDEAWNRVSAHLIEELGYFHAVERWFGDGGHFRDFLTEVSRANEFRLREVKGLSDVIAALEIKDETGFLTTIVSVAKDIGEVANQVPEVGKYIKEAVGLAAGIVQGDTDELKPQSFTGFFRDYDQKVNEQFGKIVDQYRIWGDVLKNNWGKLSYFGQSIYNGQLSLPDDRTALRAEAQRIFEITLWKAVLPQVRGIARFRFGNNAPGVVRHPQWNPDADCYAWDSYPPWSPGSSEVYTVTHSFRLSIGAIGAGSLLPTKFLHRLFGTQPRNGVAPLRIRPQEFFASQKSAQNPWTQIPWIQRGIRIGT